MTDNSLFWIVSIFVVIAVYKLLLSDSEIQSSYHSTKSLNATDLGFVKPEQRLLKVFSSISSGTKVRLQGTCQEIIYTKNTIDKLVNDSIVRLVRRMIDTVKQVTRQDYYMKRIENVYIQRDQKGNERYITDFFVFDVANYYTIRLIGDIVLIDDDMYINYLNVLSGSNPTLLNKYDTKFNQMGILFDANMFHENVRDLFDTYYLNSFKVIGVTDSEETNREDLSGVYTLGALENMYFPSDESLSTIKDYTNKGLAGDLEQYLPPDQTDITSPSFCDKSQLKWDSLGVPYPTDKTCTMDNTASLAVMNHPYFAPGVMYKRSSDDAYSWLKDPARGNIIRASGYSQ